MLINFKWSVVSAYHAIIPKDVLDILDFNNYGDNLTEDVLGASFNINDTLSYLSGLASFTFYAKLMNYNIIASLIPLIRPMSNAIYKARLNEDT